MYCPYCQTTLADDAAFCSQCGKSVSSPEVSSMDQHMRQYQVQKDAIRNTELASMNRLIQHFSQKQAAYDLYDETCKQLPRYARGTKSAPLVFGCIITALALFCIFAMGFLLFWPGSEYYMGVPFSWKNLVSLTKTSKDIQMLSQFTFVLIAGPVLISVWIINKTRNTKRKKFYQEQYASLSRELNNHYLDYPNCPVGAEYTNPRILARLEKLILSGRADTIKESINRLIADSNQRAIESYLEEIQRNTASINRSLRFGSIFIASRFFK